MPGNLFDLFPGVNARPVTAASTAVTAGGAGDATQVNGLVIDLNDQINLDKGQRAIAAFIFGVATVANTKSLFLGANWQMADDAAISSNVTSVGDSLANTNLVFTASGAQTAKPWGVRITLNYELVTQRYVRVRFTPDLDASGTDTATIFGVYLIGGAQEVPTPATKAYTVAA